MLASFVWLANLAPMPLQLISWHLLQTRGGGGTSIYKVYSYVPLWNVEFLNSLIGLGQGI